MSMEVTDIASKSELPIPQILETASEREREWQHRGSPWACINWESECSSWELWETAVQGAQLSSSVQIAASNVCL